MSDEVERYYDEYWSASRPSPLDDPLAAPRLRRLRELLRSLPPRPRVVDMGAGAGDLVATLAADGAEASGFDVSARAVELARRRHPDCEFAVASAEDLPWPVEPGSVDVVVAFEVIEHLLRPRRLLEGARAALTPGGALALSAPYHGRIKNTALSLAAFERHFAVEGDHVRFFTDRSLRQLLVQTGFRVERTFHLGRAPFLWANTMIWARRR